MHIARTQPRLHSISDTGDTKMMNNRTSWSCDYVWFALNSDILPQNMHGGAGTLVITDTTPVYRPFLHQGLTMETK